MKKKKKLSVSADITAEIPSFEEIMRKNEEYVKREEERIGSQLTNMVEELVTQSLENPDNPDEEYQNFVRKLSIICAQAAVNAWNMCYQYCEHRVDDMYKVKHGNN